MAPLCNQEENVFYNEEDSDSCSLTESSSSSSPIETPPASRSVSFSPGAAVHLGAVMHIDDYSDAEKCDCWYQAQEMREIRKEVKDTIVLMNQMVHIDEIMVTTGDDDDDDDNNDNEYDNATVTTRGLEGKTRAGKRHRRETRLASLAAVFDEQTMQDMDCISDPNMIAMTYREYAYPMQVAAFQRASQYEKEAAIRDNIDTNNEDKVDQQSSSPAATATADTFTSTDNSSCDDDEDDKVPVGTTKYDFQNGDSTQPFGKLLELEETEDDAFDESSSPSLTATTDTETETATNIKVVGYDTNSLNNSNDIHNHHHGVNNNNNRPYNIGPLRIRDRFTCLLPGSSSNRRSLMGALRVVQI